MNTVDSYLVELPQSSSSCFSFSIAINQRLVISDLNQAGSEPFVLCRVIIAIFPTIPPSLATECPAWSASEPASRGGDVIFPWSFAESIQTCLQIIDRYYRMHAPTDPSSTEPCVQTHRSCRNRKYSPQLHANRANLAFFTLNSLDTLTIILTYLLSFKHDFPLHLHPTSEKKTPLHRHLCVTLSSPQITD